MNADVRDQLNKRVKKFLCESDHLYFTRYFFHKRQNLKFIVNWHHLLISDTVERVMRGELQNVIINVSPGSSKTEIVSINLMARGLAINPWSRFLHLSYSDDLALLNSQAARDIIQSDEFQELWPLEIADDAKSKKRWNVVVNGKQAGGVYAASLGGQITGFRAGHMKEGFNGCIILDDPQKTEDAYSKTKLAAAQRKLLSTVKSRKASPKTPIIIIMQRLAQDDVTGFIESGGIPGKWELIKIPALIDNAYVDSLPERIKKRVVSDDRLPDGRFSYWPYKEPAQELLESETGGTADKDGSRMSRHVFAGQYMQNPVALGGNVIRGAWFRRYSVTPKIVSSKIYADTAQKTKEHNDFSVFLWAGLAEDGNVYVLDLIRGKWEAPELERNCIDFWNKCSHRFHVSRLCVEDKVSGTGLIQSLQRKSSIPVQAIERNKDKLTRVMDVVGYFESGHVLFPEDAPWVSDLVTECEAFTADDTHAHDDQVDTLVDATLDLLCKPKPMAAWGRR